MAGSCLLMWNTSGEQAWLMPYPPDPKHPPRRILESLPSHEGTPQFSWLPDNRRIVVSAAESGTRRHLYFADTASGKFRSLTDGMGSAQQFAPVVSPDGKRMVFVEYRLTLHIETMDVHTAAVSPLSATSLGAQMPAWSADGRWLTYQVDRNGEGEIWVRDKDKGDRPVVTEHDFPPGTTEFLFAPDVSPDGTRVMYVRVGKRRVRSNRYPLVDVFADRRSAGAAARWCGSAVVGVLVAGRRVVRVSRRAWSVGRAEESARVGYVRARHVSDRSPV